MLSVISLEIDRPVVWARSEYDRPVAQTTRGKAVSAATRTFTANSMMRCFFIFFSLIDCFLSHTKITEITEISRPSDSSISHRNHRNHRNFSSYGLFYCPEVFFYCPAEMKEIKEIFALLSVRSLCRRHFLLFPLFLRDLKFCAQAVPEALSAISVNFCVTFSRCRRRRYRRCRSRAGARCRRSPRRPRPSPATWPPRTSG